MKLNKYIIVCGLCILTALLRSKATEGHDIPREKSRKPNTCCAWHKENLYISKTLSRRPKEVTMPQSCMYLNRLPFLAVMVPNTKKDTVKNFKNYSIYQKYFQNIVNNWRKSKCVTRKNTLCKGPDWPVTPKRRIAYSLIVKPISRAWVLMFLLNISLPVKYSTPQ